MFQVRVFFSILVWQTLCAASAPAQTQPETARPSFDVKKRLEQQAIKVVFQPRHQLVISSEVEGRILDLPLKLGDQVSIDSLLVRVDSDRYRLAYEKSLAELEQLKRKLEIVEDLYEFGDESTLDLAEAKAAVQIKRSESEYTKLQLDAATITSPINGHVAEVIVNEYEYVERGKPILRVIDDSKLKGVMLLPANLLGKIALGEELTIRLVGSKEQITGKVLHIAPYIDPTSSTVRVEIEVENPHVLPGMVGFLFLHQLMKSGEKR